MINQPNQGLGGWAVPVATLVAALIAATFLTINEALKRRREDRRQWDKEVRDLCVSASHISDALYRLMWDAGWTAHSEPKPRIREQLSAMFLRQQPDCDPLPYQRRYIMSCYPEAARMRSELEDLKDRANLIAQPATVAAFEKLVAAATNASASMSDGLLDKETRRAVRRAEAELTAAVKEDIRIEIVWFRRTRKRIEKSRSRRWTKKTERQAKKLRKSPPTVRAKERTLPRAG